MQNSLQSWICQYVVVIIITRLITTFTFTFVFFLKFCVVRCSISWWSSGTSRNYYSGYCPFWKCWQLRKYFTIYSCDWSSVERHFISFWTCLLLLLLNMFLMKTNNFFYISVNNLCKLIYMKYNIIQLKKPESYL